VGGWGGVELLSVELGIKCYLSTRGVPLQRKASPNLTTAPHLHAKIARSRKLRLPQTSLHARPDSSASNNLALYADTTFPFKEIFKPFPVQLR